MYVTSYVYKPRDKSLKNVYTYVVLVLYYVKVVGSSGGRTGKSQSWVVRRTFRCVSIDGKIEHYLSNQNGEELKAHVP